MSAVLGSAALASTAFLLYLALEAQLPGGGQSGAAGAFAVFLWALFVREVAFHRGSYLRMFESAPGSTVRESAVASLEARGYATAEDEKAQSLGATIYRLRWTRGAARARAEIWSHGNRSRVTVRITGVNGAGERDAILAAFAPKVGERADPA